jgi:hypothetical protein
MEVRGDPDRLSCLERQHVGRADPAHDADVGGLLFRREGPAVPAAGDPDEGVGEHSVLGAEKRVENRFALFHFHHGVGIELDGAHHR